MSVIAILLSGGQGRRLGKQGRQLPKPLTRIGDVPISNTLVDKLLNLRDDSNSSAVNTIYILLRKKQELDPAGTDPERSVGLKANFDGWKTIWYRDNERVVLVYEDDLATAGDVDTGPMVDRAAHGTGQSKSRPGCQGVRN